MRERDMHQPIREGSAFFHELRTKIWSLIRKLYRKGTTLKKSVESLHACYKIAEKSLASMSYWLPKPVE